MQKLIDKILNRFVKNLEQWCGVETEDTKLNDSYNSNFKVKTK